MSIILNTHRTRPDSAKDAIVLKNLVSEAEQRLKSQYSREEYEPVLESLKAVLNEIDHNYNLEGLLIFAGKNHREFARIPLAVQDRVVVNERFASRDIVRAMNQEAAYYVLVFSRRNARLIEAYNEKVVREFETAWFPMENPVVETDPLILTMAQGQDNIIEQWTNQIDKAMLEQTQSNPLPVVLACEKRNYEHYMKTADRSERIIGHINRTRDEDAAHHIVADAWKEVKGFLKEKNEKRLSELDRAVSSGKFLTDYNDIWRAVWEGRGDTMFVRRGLMHPAVIENGSLVLAESRMDKSSRGYVEDIIDEMVAVNLSHGGEAVFIEGDALDNFQGLALTTRY